jgi:hypothetical protein
MLHETVVRASHGRLPEDFERKPARHQQRQSDTRRRGDARSLFRLWGGGK